LAGLGVGLLAGLLALLPLAGCQDRAADKEASSASSRGKKERKTTLVADRRGAAGAARRRAAGASAGAPLKVLGAAILTIGEKYVAPSRIDPRKMFDKALEHLEAERAEVRITGDARSRRVKVQVGPRSRTFRLKPLSSASLLYTELKSILGWVRGAIEANADGPVKPRELAEVEYAAVNGVVSTLDPHSVLMPPRVYDEMRIRTRGAFGGIGIVISIRDGRLTVISPIDGTPAAKAGIRSGDTIVKIGDESTVNMPLNDAVARLRGKPGSAVIFYVEREGWPEARRFRIVRERIEIKSVASRMLPGRVGYLRINRFSHHTTAEVKARLAKLEKADAKGLVLDLWNNPGGLLQQAERVADLFLSSGEIVITRAAHGVVARTRKATADTTAWRKPVLVLINRGSASAAEIVAGALKGQDRALVMGETSFGKGTVQALFENDDGSALKLTVAQYLTPGEISIQGSGVVPDVMTNAVLLRERFTRMFGDEVDARRRARREDLLPVKAHEKHEPAVRLDYLRPKKGKDDGPSRYSVAENAADAAVVELARRLLARHGGPRPQMLRASKEFLARWDRTQERRIITALRARGVDWSAPPAEHTAAPAARLQIQTRVLPKGPVTAGESIRLQVRVTNRGERAVYRLRGRTAAPGYFLDERELLVGKLAPGRSHSRTLELKIPSHVRSSIQPVRVLLRSPSFRGKVEKKLRVAVKGLPRPRFHLAYRLHDDVKGNGDGKPQRGETVRLRVRVHNVGEGPLSDGVVALRNLTGRGINVLRGRQAIKGLAAQKTVTADLVFRLEPTLDKKRMKLELSVFDSRVRAGLQEHLFMPVDPAKASADGLVGEITPPEVTLQDPPLEVPAGTKVLRIRGAARDDHGVRDLFVEVSNYDAKQIRRKVHYQAAGSGAQPKRMTFETEVPLWKGLNTVLVVARENEEVMGMRRLVVLRP